jgi:hypothetical protein
MQSNGPLPQVLKLQDLSKGYVRRATKGKEGKEGKKQQLEQKSSAFGQKLTLQRLNAVCETGISKWLYSV